MTCEQCGMPCQGSLCEICEAARRQRTRYGTADDDVGAWSADETERQADEWAIEQQSLTGDAHTGQATLDGGVAKDGGRPMSTTQETDGPLSDDERSALESLSQDDDPELARIADVLLQSFTSSEEAN